MAGQTAPVETPKTGITGEGAARATLIECRILSEQFAPMRGAHPREYNWVELCALLAPHKTKEAMVQIRQAQPGTFIGLVRSRFSNSVVTFRWKAPDLSGDIEQILKADSKFESRLVRVFRVESVRWPGAVSERRADS